MSGETTVPQVVLGIETDEKKAKEKYAAEFRRDLELRTTFYDRLSALAAGSVAIAASVVIAFVAKPELRPSLHGSATWLTIIIIFLWLSLVCSVAHNFTILRIAKREVLSSELESQLAADLTLMSSKHSAVAIDLYKAGGKRWSENIYHIFTLHFRAATLGYVSIGAFLVAYTLVVVCVVRLCWKI